MIFRATKMSHPWMWMNPRMPRNLIRNRLCVYIYLYDRGDDEEQHVPHCDPGRQLPPVEAAGQESQEDGRDGKHQRHEEGHSPLTDGVDMGEVTLGQRLGSQSRLKPSVLNRREREERAGT